jgi:hypothetical protein
MGQQQTVFCDKCERVAFIGWASNEGPSTWYACGQHAELVKLRGVRWWHANRESGGPRLHWILTDENYAARGAVVVEGGRWIGYDTSGRVLFDRKDYAGAISAAEKRLGLRCVARGYYGIGSPYEMDGLSAPENMRRKMSDKAKPGA